MQIFKVEQAQLQTRTIAAIEWLNWAKQGWFGTVRWAWDDWVREHDATTEGISSRAGSARQAL